VVESVQNLSLNLSRGVADGTAVGYRAGLEISSYLSRRKLQGRTAVRPCVCIKKIVTIRTGRPGSGGDRPG